MKLKRERVLNEKDIFPQKKKKNTLIKFWGVLPINLAVQLQV